MTTFNIFLADLIYIFHFIIILFILFVPFTKTPSYLILHIVFSFSLLVHWYNNNNICSLSLFESKLRGIEYNNSFSHQFIAPVYDISSTKWGETCYYAVILLAIISFYNLITSEQWKFFKECLDKTKEYINKNTNIKINEKIKLYINCLYVLF